MDERQLCYPCTMRLSLLTLMPARLEITTLSQGRVEPTEWIRGGGEGRRHLIWGPAEAGGEISYRDQYNLDTDLLGFILNQLLITRCGIPKKDRNNYSKE